MTNTGFWILIKQLNYNSRGKSNTPRKRHRTNSTERLAMAMSPERVNNYRFWEFAARFHYPEAEWNNLSSEQKVDDLLFISLEAKVKMSTTNSRSFIQLMANCGRAHWPWLEHQSHLDWSSEGIRKAESCSQYAGTDKGRVGCELHARKINKVRGQAVKRYTGRDSPCKKTERVSKCDATHCRRAKALHTRFDWWACRERCNMWQKSLNIHGLLPRGLTVRWGGLMAG